MKKILVVCMLLSLGLTCFLVGCNKGERKGLEPKYNATITVSENNNGDGVANANIFCDGNKVGETDSNGKYVLDDLSGEHEIKVSASGYLFENDKMKVSQNSKEVTFKAIKSFKLSGTVQSGDILIQGAKVKIEGDHPSEILTDINGKFAIDTTGNATKITAEYQGVIFEEDNSGYNKTTENNNIVFNGYYRKTVVVRSGNLRINNAKVQVTDNTGELYINTSGSNGEYTFNKLYGSLSINAVHNEYDDDGPTISNSIGDSVQINKKFTLKGSITGVDLEGVVVSAAGITTTTNESGEFTLSGLSGNVALNVAKTNYTYVYSADNALLNSKTYNFAVVNINIKVQSFLISGTVTSGSIKVYDAEVSSDKQFGASPIKTDALGNFSIWVTEPCVIAFLKDEYSINSYHVDKVFPVHKKYMNGIRNCRRTFLNGLRR